MSETPTTGTPQPGTGDQGPPPQPVPAQPVPSSPSITLGIVMLLLVALAIFGAIAVVLGLGGTSALDIKIGDFKIKTQAVGFGIMALSLLAIVGMVKYMPTTTHPFAGPNQQSPLERASPGLFLLGAASLVAGVIVAIVNH